MDVYSLLGRFMLALQGDDYITNVEIDNTSVGSDRGRVPTYVAVVIHCQNGERFTVTIERGA